MIAEAKAKERETLRLRQKVQDLSALLREVAEREGMDEEELTATRKFGYTEESVARFFGVTTSLVNRYAASGELLELRRYA